MITFTVSLTEREWDEDRKGWRCPALRIPGARVDAVFAEGKVDDAKYAVEIDQQIIRWPHADAPSQVSLDISLTQELTKKALTVFWQKLAVVIPLLTALATSLLTFLLTFMLQSKGPIPFKSPSSTTRTPSYELWHISGSVALGTRPPRAGEVVAMIRPPNLALLPDGSFEDDIPVKNNGKGVRQFPSITFAPTIAGYGKPVVHLGPKVENSPYKQYKQDIDEEDKTIGLSPVSIEPTPPYAP